MSRSAILVIFYMNGCPHCPAAQDACDGVGNLPTVHIESSHPLVKELGIHSFPTIWLSTPTAVYQYKDRPRVSRAIKIWILSK